MLRALNGEEFQSIVRACVSGMTPSSSIEFLVWLLIAAAIIAMLAKRLRIPYTVSLVLGGLLLGVIHIPILSPLQPGNRPDWLTPDVILILFLPARQPRGATRRPCDGILRALFDRPARSCCASLRIHHLRHRPHFCAGHFQRSESRQAAVPHHAGRKPSQ